MPDLVERYLVLGLQLGRHVDGLVDAYYGPPGLRSSVEEGPLREPATLAADADALLDELAGAELEDGRRGWLGDQLLGLRTYAGVLAGERLSYADEVERCYGVRPALAPEERYAAVHERLDELLPGDGSLLDRSEAWKRSQLVAGDRLIDALRDVVAFLRGRTVALLDLPTGEEAALEPVHDEPWWAFNYYLGSLRSRVVVNLDVPTTADDLVELAAHEVYPGHHTEHAVKEQRLLRDRGLLEESLQLVPTPQALVSEGIAEVGPHVVLDEGAFEELSSILRRHGIDYGVALARELRRAKAPLRSVGLDAALLIHEHGATEAEAQAWVERWGPAPPERAAHTVQFALDPTWRAYAVTYSAGRELAGAYVGDDATRFVRLLTEQVRVGELLASLSSGA